MRVLITSHRFHPDIGGIETTGGVIAGQLVAAGHEVQVVTGSVALAPDVFPYRVLRRPGPLQLLGAVRWCDVLLQNHIGLRTLWPLLLLRRPWVIIHATWIRRGDGSLGWQDRLKRYLARFAVNIANSRATAEDLGLPCISIGNPYRDGLFMRLPDIPKDRDIVFLGRLVSDKGAHILLEAVGKLAGAGLRPSVTLVGGGPELGALQQQAERLGISGQVDFPGARTGVELVRLLNRHRIMAIPSLWKEPFGIVALEGAACGAALVGSDSGGLPEAMGPCGLRFPNGDSDALADRLQSLLSDDQLRARLAEAAPEHLALHTERGVVARYIGVLQDALESAGPRKRP